MEMPEIDGLSNKIIGLAILVHRELGPGLLESVYMQCLAHEMRFNKIVFLMEEALPVVYKGVEIDCGFRADMIVENSIILELKAVEKLLPIHKAQLMTYLKITGIKLGLIMNFNVTLLRAGIKRIIL